jgi:hypothetical protein
LRLPLLPLLLLLLRRHRRRGGLPRPQEVGSGGGGGVEGGGAGRRAVDLHLGNVGDGPEEGGDVLDPVILGGNGGTESGSGSGSGSEVKFEFEPLAAGLGSGELHGGKGEGAARTAEEVRIAKGGERGRGGPERTGREWTGRDGTGPASFAAAAAGWFGGGSEAANCGSIGHQGEDDFYVPS